MQGSLVKGDDRLLLYRCGIDGSSPSIAHDSGVESAGECVREVSGAVVGEGSNPVVVDGLVGFEDSGVALA